MTRTTMHCRKGCCKTGRPDVCFTRWECACHTAEKTAAEQADKLWAWQQEMLKGQKK